MREARHDRALFSIQLRHESALCAFTHGLSPYGNARTALINALFARSHGGTYQLRLDDTDVERSRPEYADAIREDLAWLGISWHETFRQAERVASMPQRWSG